MIAGLEVSTLTCWCVFYRLEHNAKGGTAYNWILKVLKCRKEIYQRTELKERWGKWGNLSSYRVVLLPELKHGKWLIFVDDRKKLFKVWAKYLSAPGRSYWALSENSMTKIDFGVTGREILRVEMRKKYCRWHVLFPVRYNLTPISWNKRSLLIDIV